MAAHTNETYKGAVFITFSGNCKQALLFYQSCFGGNLKLEPFGKELLEDKEIIVSGSLYAEHITIHGSDLVHNEGRKLGNYISVYFGCKDREEREKLTEKLIADKKQLLELKYRDQSLVELTDAFEVRWVLGLQEKNFRQLKKTCIL